ncbi:MAG: DUF4398 domain-containing protein [Myxococcales bacterium]|jgi:hypothetical protein
MLPVPVRRARVALSSILLSLLSLAATGCGPALYLQSIDDAEDRLQLARQENARWYAPYEFYFAQAHLDKAREEAAEGAYEDAIRYARTATDFSSRAIEITETRRVAGQ